MVQPAMRSLRRNHGRFHASHPGRKDQGDGASGTDRREWSRAWSTVNNPMNRQTSEKPPGTEGISPKSRGDERTEIQEHRVGGKTAPVTARWGRAVAGRQAGGGGGTCRRDTRTEI